MLMRDAKTIGCTNYPYNVVHKFCKQDSKSGVDVLWFFGYLNYIDNLKLGVDTVCSAGGFVEAPLSYTGDVSDHKKGK